MVEIVVNGKTYDINDKNKRLFIERVNSFNSLYPSKNNDPNSPLNQTVSYRLFIYSPIDKVVREIDRIITCGQEKKFERALYDIKPVRQNESKTERKSSFPSISGVVNRLRHSGGARKRENEVVDEDKALGHIKIALEYVAREPFKIQPMTRLQLRWALESSSYKFVYSQLQNVDAFTKYPGLEKIFDQVYTEAAQKSKTGHTK